MAYTVSSTPSAAARTMDFVLQNIAQLPDDLARIEFARREQERADKLAGAKMGMMAEETADLQQMRNARQQFGEEANRFIQQTPNVDGATASAVKYLSSTGDGRGVIAAQNAFLDRQLAQQDRAAEDAATTQAWQAFGLGEKFGGSMSPEAMRFVMRNYKPQQTTAPAEVLYRKDAQGNPITLIQDGKGGVQVYKAPAAAPTPQLYSFPLPDGTTRSGIAHGNSFIPFAEKSPTKESQLPPFVYFNGKVIPRELPKSHRTAFNSQTGAMENITEGGGVNPEYSAAIAAMNGYAGQPQPAANAPQDKAAQVDNAVNKFFQ